MERAREHANEVADQVIIDQVTLFELATRDPGRLRSGELTPLPSPADNADDFTHYDRLVAEGDLEAVIAFLQRFRLRKRINDLVRMRVTGNLAEFIPLASTLYPQLASGPRIVFARLLLAEELRILQAAEEDIAFHEFPRLAVEHAGAGRSTNEPHLFGQSGVLAPQISLDELFQRWEQEADPSASTLSTWRGVVKNLKAHLGRKAADIRSIDSEVARILELASAATEPWKRWLPWLAVSTGSRIGEVAQLHGSHVLELEGIYVVKIAPAIDGGSIKNVESERYVPIHSKLIADGFLDFVKSRGDGPLFYNRTSGDPKRKHASKGLSNRLAAWIRENGFTDPRKAPNHALRHWFKSEAARIGIPDSVADAIQGHSDGRAASGYRHISLQSMASAIESMRLPPSRALSSQQGFDLAKPNDVLEIVT